MKIPHRISWVGAIFTTIQFAAVLAYSDVFAGSATWKIQPPGGIWNNASSWTPATIPNGPADTATFATSQRRSITPNEPTEVNSIVFSAGGAAFTITSGVGAPLTISGTGIVNNSGLTQAFVSPATLSIFFTNGASAGGQTTFTNSGAEVSGGLGGLTQFSGTATAASATFTNHGTSQTGEASGGLTEFLEDSTADQGTFVNNGGVATIAHGGMTVFRGNSTAGTGSFINNVSTAFGFPGATYFYDNASADHGTFSNYVAFFNSSTAANGTFTLGDDDDFGVISFLDTSSAGTGTFTIQSGQIHVSGSVTLANATITANAGSVDMGDAVTADHAILIANGGTVAGQIADKGSFGFGGDSTAAEATLVINPGTVAGAVGGTIGFGSAASAGDSNITVNGAAVTGDIAEGLLTFSSSANDTNATAANATIVATGGSSGGKGGEVQFLRNGLGGTCHIQLLGNSQLDLAPDRTRDLTIGSLEGEGTVFLGGHGLIIGSNNLSTLFSGRINDGEGGTVPPGSLSKIGTGTLELASPTAYTGGTTVSAGALVVSNKIGSATGTGPVQVIFGTLGGSGIVAGDVTIGTDTSSGATLAPAHGTPRQATFTTQAAVTFNTNSGYTYSFKAKGNKAKTDLVVANGVTINSGVTFTAQATTVGSLPLGLVLTLISNTSANPISGTFSNLGDGAIVTINGNNFQASYTGGDGNDLTLTVVP